MLLVCVHAVVVADPVGAVRDWVQPAKRTVIEKEPAGHDQFDQVMLKAAVGDLEGESDTGFPADGRVGAWKVGTTLPDVSTMPTAGTPISVHRVDELFRSSTAPGTEVEDLLTTASCAVATIWRWVHARVRAPPPLPAAGPLPRSPIDASTTAVSTPRPAVSAAGRARHGADSRSALARSPTSEPRSNRALLIAASPPRRVGCARGPSTGRSSD